LQERGLVGLEARTADGSEVIGRISEVLTDEDTGEVTHVIVETDDGRDEELIEVPISSVNLDPDADFATFHADASDDEPGDHLGDEERPAGYAPNREVGPEDWPHQGQFVTSPQDEGLAQTPEELDRQADEAGGFQDEEFTPFESGYPRNDAYIDPDTGEEREHYPAEGDDLRTDVEQLLDGTGLRLREIREGVVVLEGSAGGDDLRDLVGQISDIEEVFDVDATDVDVS
jgi:PRC-barrel domain